MINEETRRKLRDMKLEMFLAALDNQEFNLGVFTGMSFDERLTLAVDECYAARNADRAKRLLRSAKLRFPTADLASIYYEGRDLDRTVVQTLGTCSFIEKNVNVIINGFTGSGKTHLACALVKEACTRLHRSRYYRMPDLLEVLKMARDSSSHDLMNAYNTLSKYHVLVIDEWLLNTTSLEETHMLFEVIERRYDVWPTIFCSQYKTEEWHTRLGGGTSADSVMDRIIHNSVVLNAGKMNMRELNKRRLV